jgi:hypothetical protein
LSYHSIKQEILPSLERLLSDLTTVGELNFLNHIRSKLSLADNEEKFLAVFLELSTVMYSGYSFSNLQLEKISDILGKCEKIALTFSADSTKLN